MIPIIMQPIPMISIANDPYQYQQIFPSHSIYESTSSTYQPLPLPTDAYIFGVHDFLTNTAPAAAADGSSNHTDWNTSFCMIDEFNHRRTKTHLKQKERIYCSIDDEARLWIIRLHQIGLSPSMIQQELQLLHPFMIPFKLNAICTIIQRFKKHGLIAKQPKGGNQRAKRGTDIIQFGHSKLPPKQIYQQLPHNEQQISLSTIRQRVAAHYASTESITNELTIESPRLPSSLTSSSTIPIIHPSTVFISDPLNSDSISTSTIARQLVEMSDGDIHIDKTFNPNPELVESMESSNQSVTPMTTSDHTNLQQLLEDSNCEVIQMNQVIDSIVNHTQTSQPHPTEINIDRMVEEESNDPIPPLKSTVRTTVVKKSTKRKKAQTRLNTTTTQTTTSQTSNINPPKKPKLISMEVILSHYHSHILSFTSSESSSIDTSLNDYQNYHYRFVSGSDLTKEFLRSWYLCYLIGEKKKKSVVNLVSDENKLLDESMMLDASDILDENESLPNKQQKQQKKSVSQSLLSTGLQRVYGTLTIMDMHSSLSKNDIDTLNYALKSNHTDFSKLRDQLEEFCFNQIINVEPSINPEGKRKFFSMTTIALLSTEPGTLAQFPHFDTSDIETATKQWVFIFYLMDSLSTAVGNLTEFQRKELLNNMPESKINELFKNRFIIKKVCLGDFLMFRGDLCHFGPPVINTNSNRVVLFCVVSSRSVAAKAQSIHTHVQAPRTFSVSNSIDLFQTDKMRELVTRQN